MWPITLPSRSTGISPWPVHLIEIAVKEPLNEFNHLHWASFFQYLIVLGQDESRLQQGRVDFMISIAGRRSK